MPVRIGTQFLEATQLSDGRYKLTVQAITSLSEVSEKIFVGGLPLTLAQYSNGDYVLCAVVEANLTDNSDYTMYNGYPLTVERQNNEDGNYVLNTQESLNSIGTRDYTMFNGFPLAISENKELIFQLNTETVNSYVNFIFGSSFLRAAEINNNYYLLIGLDYYI